MNISPLIVHGWLVSMDAVGRTCVGVMHCVRLDVSTMYIGIGNFVKSVRPTAFGRFVATGGTTGSDGYVVFGRSTEPDGFIAFDRSLGIGNRALRGHLQSIRRRTQFRNKWVLHLWVYLYICPCGV